MAEGESKAKSKKSGGPAQIGDDQPKVPGVDEVQEKFDEAAEQGFLGRSDKPIPNSEFSQETDPTQSPSAYEQHVAALGVEAERRKRK